MSLEIIKMLVESACSDGTISDQDRSLLQKKATDLGISQDVLKKMIEEALNPSTKQPVSDNNDASGFITDDNTTPPIVENIVKTPVVENKLTTKVEPQSIFSDITMLESQGAMSLVQKGKLHGKWIIIKRIKPEFKNNAKYKELFYKEFENAYHLDHPNIIRLLDKGEDHEGAYYTMEFVDGRALNKITTNQGITDERLVKRIMQQILDGLTYVHKKQVFHRDLKPDNILVTYRGDNVKILDFGLAAADSFEDNLVKVGTPKYAAPEQMIKGSYVDQRADIYAIGLMFLEILTGSTDDKTASSVKNPNYKQIITTCLKQNPQERFNDCQEIIELLNKPVPVVQEPVKNEVVNAELANLKLRGDNAYNIKDYATAKNLYEQYLAKEPNNLDVKNKYQHCLNNLKPATEGKKIPIVPIAIAAVVVLLLVVGIIFKDKIFGGGSSKDNDSTLVVDYFGIYLKSADSLFELQDYTAAKDFYNKAKDKKQDAAVLEKIRIIDEVIKNRNEADALFDAKNVARAITFYNKVLDASPKDTHSTERIKACNDLIAKTIFKELTNESEASSNKVGFKNGEGYVVIDYMYDEVSEQLSFWRGNGIIPVATNGKWGYYINSIKNFIPCEYDAEGTYMQGNLVTKKNGDTKKFSPKDYSN